MFPIRVQLRMLRHPLEHDRNPSSASIRERVTRARANLARVADIEANRSHPGIEPLTTKSGLPASTVYDLLVANACLDGRNRLTDDDFHSVARLVIKGAQ
jgi:hypothetical protein